MKQHHYACMRTTTTQRLKIRGRKVASEEAVIRHMPFRHVV
jgi:hypothetical protein